MSQRQVRPGKQETATETDTHHVSLRSAHGPPRRGPGVHSGHRQAFRRWRAWTLVRWRRVESGGGGGGAGGGEGSRDEVGERAGRGHERQAFREKNHVFLLLVRFAFVRTVGWVALVPMDLTLLGALSKPSLVRERGGRRTALRGTLRHIYGSWDMGGRQPRPTDSRDVSRVAAFC